MYGGFHQRVWIVEIGQAPRHSPQEYRGALGVIRRRKERVGEMIRLAPEERQIDSPIAQYVGWHAEEERSCPWPKPQSHHS